MKQTIIEIESNTTIPERIVLDGERRVSISVVDAPETFTWDHVCKTPGVWKRVDGPTEFLLITLADAKATVVVRNGELICVAGVHLSRYRFVQVHPSSTICRVTFEVPT